MPESTSGAAMRPLVAADNAKAASASRRHGIVPRRTGTAEASRATPSVQIKDIVATKLDKSAANNPGFASFRFALTANGLEATRGAAVSGGPANLSWTALQFQ